MATSGSYNYVNSRNDLIEQALRKIGALGDHTAVATDTNKLAVGVAAINPVARTLSAKGMPLWAMESAVITFDNFATSAAVTWGPSKTISTGTAGAGYRPLKVIHAIRRDSSGTDDVDVPMQIAEYTHYMSLPNKETTGTPLVVYHNPLHSWSTLNVWPLPDSTWLDTDHKMVLWLQREFQDFDGTSDEADFPKEWTEAFIYSLAYNLAPNYGLPPADRAALKADRDKLIADMEGFGTEEGSIRFQPARR
jgi:hypothetical protein